MGSSQNIKKEFEVMNTLKKSIAVLLSILMVFSAISVTAFATGAKVEVTLKSQQGLFSDITKTYEKGDTFTMTVNWQSDSLIRNGEFYTYLNNQGLKVVSEDINTKLSGVMSNITDAVQQKYNEVSVNFSSTNGCDYKTSDYIVKYEIKVLETAGEKETLTLNSREVFGCDANALAEEIHYIAAGVVGEANKDKFNLTATLSDPVEKPTDAPTTAPTSAPASSDNSDPTTPSDSQATEPSETGTTPSASETQSTTPSETQATDPSDTNSTTPSDSQATEPSESTNPTDATNPTDSTPTESTAPSTTEATEATEPSTQKPTVKPATSAGPGQSAEAVDKLITSQKNDNDPKGSQFALLQAKVKKVAKTSITIKWNKVSGAKKYVVYGNKCGKTNRFKKLKTVTGTSFTHKKLKKATYYKYLIVAVNGKGKTVTTSKGLHISTTGNAKKSNPIGVSTAAKNNKVNLKKGKTFNLKAKSLAKKGTKVSIHRVIKYESTNTKIATVNAKGKITAKKKGVCYVYAYAQNGLAKKIKVTVK